MSTCVSPLSDARVRASASILPEPSRAFKPPVRWTHIRGSGCGCDARASTTLEVDVFPSHSETFAGRLGGCPARENAV